MSAWILISIHHKMWIIVFQSIVGLFENKTFEINFPIYSLSMMWSIDMLSIVVSAFVLYIKRVVKVVDAGVGFIDFTHTHAALMQTCGPYWFQVAIEMV